MRGALLTGFLIVVIGTGQGWAQVQVSGRVLDKHSLEPIPFATVRIKNRYTGTLTDENGNFRLEDLSATDTLVIEMAGYETEELSVKELLARTDRLILLSRSVLELEATVIPARYNPALQIVKRAIANREQNNPNALPPYRVEAYTKTEIDLTNINRELVMNIKWLKPFAFVLDYMDTTSDIKPFLPVFLTEALSDIYADPIVGRRREYIKASQLSGVRSQEVTQYLGSLYQNINIYDGWMQILDVPFVSPINPLAPLFYNYKLLDTAHIYGVVCYKISFVPQNRTFNGFRGELWIADSSWAVVRASMEKVPWANINWVQRMSVYQSFRPAEVNGETKWVPEKDKIVVDFVSPGNVTLGLIGRRTITYREWRFYPPDIEEKLSVPRDVVVLPGAQDINTWAWDTLRHEELSPNERLIYFLVDTIQRVPQFKTFTEVVRLIVTGSKRFGKIEVGPYFSLVSTDEVEGVRIRLGISTSEEFSERMYLSAYGAWGTQDRQFKWGMEGKIVLSREPWQQVGFRYKYDLNLESEHWDELNKDNVLAFGLKKRGVSQRLFFETVAEGWYLIEAFPYFYVQPAIAYREITPKFFPSESSAGLTRESTINTVYATEAMLKLTFAYREKYIQTKYSRYTIDTDFPIFSLFFQGSYPPSPHKYLKVRLSVEGELELPPRQEMQYVLSGGWFWGGAVPFSLLHLFEGNYTYYFNWYAYNAMNPVEFVAERYLSAYIYHRLNGMLFDLVPLLRKLHLREAAYLRVLYGRVYSANIKQLDIYGLSSPSPVPYMEAGVGVENILRLVRIMCVWRLTHLGKQQVVPFGVYGSFLFRF